MTTTSAAMVLMLLLDARGARQIPKYSLGLHFLIRIYIALLLLVFPVSKFWVGLPSRPWNVYIYACLSHVNWIFLKSRWTSCFPRNVNLFCPKSGDGTVIIVRTHSRHAFLWDERRREKAYIRLFACSKQLHYFTVWYTYSQQQVYLLK